MKHEDWLYLIEFFTKRGELEKAETVVRAMKWEEPPTIIRIREKINKKS